MYWPSGKVGELIILRCVKEVFQSLVEVCHFEISVNPPSLALLVPPWLTNAFSLLFFLIKQMI